MEKVFILWHVYELEDDFGVHDEEKMIGVFSSRAKALEAIALVKDNEGFCDHPITCFEISTYEMNRIEWFEGFITVHWSEE